MTDSRLATVQSLYDAFASGDGETLSRLLSDVTWEEAGGMPYGGTYRGFAEVAENVFGPIGADVEGFSAKPDELLPVADDMVLARGHYRGTANGNSLDVPFGHLWTVDGDRITAFYQYVDTHLFRQAVC